MLCEIEPVPCEACEADFLLAAPSCGSPVKMKMGEEVRLGSPNTLGPGDYKPELIAVNRMPLVFSTQPHTPRRETPEYVIKQIEKGRAGGFLSVLL
jgi:hypothetical protein